MGTSDDLIRAKELLEEKEQQLQDRERQYLESAEELIAQKEELTSAIEALVSKNNALTDALTSLQQRNEELDQVLYRASHDFRTPVSSLKGLLELLSRDLMTDTQRSIYQHMDAKVQQMESMLASLQSLSDAAFRKLSITSFSAGEVYGQVLQEMKSHRRFSQATIALEGEQETLRTDMGLMHIVLAALCSNALAYGGPEGTRVQVLFSAGIPMRLVVSDNGKAIPEEVAAKMFDMFYRGTERSSGAGLGLYIVKTAVSRLGGRVTYHRASDWNQFIVEIPKSDSLEPPTVFTNDI